MDKKMAAIVLSTFMLAAPAFADALALVTTDESTATKIRPVHKTLEFDVAENGLAFLFDEAPLFEDMLPAYGNSFVTHGYIYPKGFLDGNDGVTDDGMPAFPEQVLGEWTCRGYFVGDAAHASTGAWVLTTQTYTLYDAPGYTESALAGATTFVSEGYELADIDVAGSRAVSGGTGDLLAATGEAMQTLLGFDDAHMGVLLRFRVDVVAQQPVGMTR